MLDEAKLRAAKPKAKPYRLAIGEGGVYLIVMPNGSKRWRYNVRRNGINTTLSLGTFPNTSLADAVSERNRLHSLARMGIHPGVARRAARTGATLGGAGIAFSVALSADGALSLTVGEQTLHLTTFQTNAVRAALMAAQP
jgi:hypothetical protein